MQNTNRRGIGEVSLADMYLHTAGNDGGIPSLDNRYTYPPSESANNSETALYEQIHTGSINWVSSAADMYLHTESSNGEPPSAVGMYLHTQSSNSGHNSNYDKIDLRSTLGGGVFDYDSIPESEMGAEYSYVRQAVMSWMKPDSIVVASAQRWLESWRIRLFVQRIDRAGYNTIKCHIREWIIYGNWCWYLFQMSNSFILYPCLEHSVWQQQMHHSFQEIIDTMMLDDSHIP